MVTDIIVTNYKTPGDLAECIDSIANHCDPAAVTVTVANVEPTDRDLEVAEVGLDYLASAHGFQTTHLTFTENVGYARACNAGALAGTGDILALCNADVAFTEGAVPAISHALGLHGTWGVVGPRQVDRIANGRFTHAGIFGSPTKPRHRGWQQPDKGQYDDIAEAVTVAGSAYFIKRKIWDQLTACANYRATCNELDVKADGAFLPTQHYYEETWCSYHARAHGWKVIYFGEATVVHKFHRASPKNGHADQQMPASRRMFRRACDAHNIECD